MSRTSLMSLRPSNVRQWVLAVLIVAVAAFGVGSYAYVSFSADSLLTSSSTNWNGGMLVLRPTTVGSGRCAVRPDEGPARDIEVVGGLDRTVVQPWFDGPATVSCNHQVSVWTGSKAKLASVVLSFPGFMIFAVGLGVLVVGYVMLGPPARPMRRSSHST